MSKIWLLKLNGDKCKHLSLGKSSESHYHNGDALVRKSLQKVVDERDLGVVFTIEMGHSMPESHCKGDVSIRND